MSSIHPHSFILPPPSSSFPQPRISLFRLSGLMKGASVERFHLETVSWHRAPIMREEVCIARAPMSDRALGDAAAAAAAAIHIVGVW